jgi:hypothetical protein
VARREGTAAAPAFERLDGYVRLRGTVRRPRPRKLREETIGEPRAVDPRARFERRRVEAGRP